jgi:hypothetical protein
MDMRVLYQTGPNTNVVEWSPDYGDYWGDIRPRLTVQDMVAPTSSLLYVVDSDANVQKLAYSGTAWSSNSPTVAVGGTGHTIEAYDANTINVGSAVSTDGGVTFTGSSSINHSIFDTDYSKNKTTYRAGSGINDGIMRGSTDMMAACGGHKEGYFGLVQTNSKNITGQGTLYGAHAPVNPCGVKGPFTNVAVDGTSYITLSTFCGTQVYSGVERTLTPLNGIPKPCIEWDCLDASCASGYQSNDPPVWFTLEPKSLDICGCADQSTNATLYALDNDRYGNTNNNNMGLVASTQSGKLWRYTDCMAKNGPNLTLDDGAIIGCDPATGRNQEVNFTWEQLCIGIDYELLIAKDKAMNLPVFDIGHFAPFFSPYNVTSPSLIYLSGGEGLGVQGMGARDIDDMISFLGLSSVPSLECGHTYYWQVRVRDETTFDQVRSPWSAVRSFTIKAGFRVTTNYYGVQLLSPDNGAGTPCTAPISFSWSPFQGATSYTFQLSSNADMSSPIVNTTVSTTAYQWTGTPKCNAVYFWRVQEAQPSPSDWSATFTFMTQPIPPSPTPPVVVTTVPAPQLTATVVIPAPVTNVLSTETPLWVWVVIAIGAILVIVVLVLIFKTRRV